MRLFSGIIILLLIVVGVTFAVMNSEAVSINYYFGKTDMALSLLLAISFAVGAIIGVLVMFFKVIKLRFSNNGLRRKLQRIEKESAKQ